MSEKPDQHSFCYENNVITVRGISQVVEVDEKQAVFKLQKRNLTVRGSGFNVARLDREQGVAVIEVGTLASVSYRQSGIGFKGLFK